TGRHAIVTGGGHGIGAAIAKVLARAGATISLMGRRIDLMEQTARQLTRRHKVDVHTFECDVANPDSVTRAFGMSLSKLGDPYILVNNAGDSEGAAFAVTSLALWNRMLAVNLTSTFLCTHEVLPLMIDAKAGRIINIASTAGLKGYTRVTAYCSAKHGVVGFTRALAIEVALLGITVNAICPAYTEGEMSERAMDAIARARDITREEARKKMERLIPIGRLIKPDEVAAAALWLCSDDAAAITGQAIAVAGGEVQ
ncbi:MAG TPA: SDR family NAD(P)-dependent oxidoreductase, partial [Longimicrobiales bacterium]|nr:SDR family NAD(P)-dependent oxidoreductase [Longimicrobiales bacterium]